jgi:hypothetical protein
MARSEKGERSGMTAYYLCWTRITMVQEGRELVLWQRISHAGTTLQLRRARFLVIEDTEDVSPICSGEFSAGVSKE